MACQDCPGCDCPECTHRIKMGPAIPVALVCNLIDDTDPADPTCMQCCGTMCYKPPDDEGVGQPVQVTPTNDWGAWQGGLGLNPVDNALIDLQTGEFITFTLDGVPNFVDGQLQNSAISGAGVHIRSAGNPSTRQIELSWDVPLTGPFAFIIDNISPGLEDVPSIVPAPTSVTPDFTTGDANTDHQVYYADITGIQSIIIDFQALTVNPSTVIIRLDESVSITSAASAVTNETIEIMVVANVCDDPPTRRFFRLDTGAEIADPEIIESLYNCDIDYVEEEVCVEVNGEYFTCIKRTLYASPPVDVFIGPNGNIVNPDSWVPGICDFETVTAYTFDCLRFDNNLPINSNATFTDAPVGTNEIIFEAADIALLVRDEIIKAQRVQSQEELHSLAVTTVVIVTDSGETYEFNPDALQSGTGSTLVIDETGIISWGIDQTDLVTELQYSVFDNCNCKAVEVLQWIKDSTEVYLLDVFDITYDQSTGQKISLLDENRLLDFLTLGPFSGPCPETLQVIEVNPLCCNDDLVQGSEEIAEQRLAWLDASDNSLMRNGGAPITGTTGEDVDEVWDKLQPGIAPSFVVPANVGFDVLATAPTFVEDGLNELSVLNFDSGDNDRLRLDTDNPPNGPFTLFYLVSATDLVLASQACILAVGPDNSDGDEFNLEDGAWQLSRDGTQPSFIFRMTGPSIPAGGPGTDPTMLVQTGPYSAETSPSDGPNPGQNDTYQLERAIATEAEFFNGQFHLITVSYDDVNQILSAYFDGELRLQMDMSVMVPQFQMASDYFRVFGNRNGQAYLSGQLAEMFFADSFLSPEETAEVNSYLICKWGIDPSIVAGGLGDLELDTPGSYSAPSPFIQIVRADGTTIYRNTLNGQEFALPPTPGLSLCEDPTIESVELQKFDWMKQLCDRIDTITGLDLFFFNDANQEVQRVNAFTGDVEDSHLPDPAIDWAHGTVFDASGGPNGYYYLYDGIAAEWHRYDAGNIAAGSVNLGVFGGDPIVGSFTFGAFDPTTGLAYVGFVGQTRYEVDFNTSTITALPVFNGHTGAPSSLSITETGLHYMTAILAGAHTILHTVDVATGTCTPTGFFSDIPLNGADYDQDTLTGFYGIGIGNLYHWTELDGSDLEIIAPAVFSGTLAVGNTVISTERVEFQRVYHKDLVSGEVTSQDHDLEGDDYEVQGTVEHCPVEVESSIETTCDDPLHVESCIISWSERLCDVGHLEVLGEDQVFVEIAPQVNINPALQLVGFSGGEGPVTGIVEAVFAVEPDVQYDYIAGHGGAGTCAGGPAAILVEIIDDGGAGAVLASQTLQYVGGVDTPGIDLGPTAMPFISATGNVMVRVSDQTPVTTICDAIFYWYDFQTTDTVSTEFQRIYHKNRETLAITAQDHDFRGNLYTLHGSIEPCHIDHEVLVLCDTDAEGCQTSFLRHFFRRDDGVLITQDTYMDGNAAYTVVGSVQPCYDVPCIDTTKAILVTLDDGETWTPASLPANHIVTGMSLNVLVEAADSSVTDADGNVSTLIPAGLSMSWNTSQDYNTLTAPQSIFAGTGGRMMINMTLRDDS